MTEATDRCQKVCVPYFQEIASQMLTEEPAPMIVWVTTPDLTNPFPPQFQFQCPHQVTWMCQPSQEQIQQWEKRYPLQPEIFPEPFVCLVVETEGGPACAYTVEPAPLNISEPLEVALAVMLNHIRFDHGAPAWGAMHHLCGHYPGLNNYSGTIERVEAFAPKDQP